ncbi:beta-N-acetylhexosaminidase [Desulfofundulus luciae]|uniref:Beta-N-acetylhexosaminidase n=1 Tax=Desulfofundulus luciae TaxID=74702 RepID=A0ABU0AZ18_9FIRM|nr:beta-N-acetylhexosaminidase [Desulfofundulus luciae]MDQ0285702.1 beta-N-acetylhexosaminidase [Desulfofundulus luciae]
MPSITNKLIFLAVIILLLTALVYSKEIKDKALAGLAYVKEAPILQYPPAPNVLKENSSSGGKENPLLMREVEEIINSLEPEEMVGQLLVVGFNGKEPDYYISRMINLRHIGGVILFTRNIENPLQVARLTNQLQNMAQTNGDLPLFIAVDQEGGEVNRFKTGLTAFPAPFELGRLASPRAAELAARDVAEELKATGINVNLAPVIDVASEKSLMARRSYGNDPQQVALLGAAAVAGAKKGGVIPCVKHFPGLGRILVDPHEKPAEIKADFATLYQNDWLPFRQAIKENVEMIMVSHARYPALDARNPASLSFFIQTVILREMLGYQGLIITDDLEMGAVNKENSTGQLAVRAVKAGADLLLICHTPEKQKEAYDALLAAVRRGEIDEQRLKESLRRIIALKLKYKLKESSQVDLTRVTARVNTHAHRQDAAKIRTAITNFISD